MITMIIRTLCNSSLIVIIGTSLLIANAAFGLGTSRYPTNAQTGHGLCGAIHRHLAQQKHTLGYQPCPFETPYYVAKPMCGSCCNTAKYVPLLKQTFAQNTSCDYEGLCARYEAPCQCTDEGWRDNCCMTHCRYCWAFGNIGAR